jgi:hypothetical protein
MARAPERCAYVRNDRRCHQRVYLLVDGTPGCSRHWQRLLAVRLETVGRAIVSLPAFTPPGGSGDERAAAA